jgi:hypothetical protein
VIYTFAKTFKDYDSTFLMSKLYVHPLLSRPEQTDNELIKILSQKDTIPFVSSLEECGLSIARISPVYFEKKGIVSILKGKEGVTTARDLKKVFIPYKNSPSGIFMTGNQTPEYIMIHAPMPDFNEDYKVNTFMRDYGKGIENVPVTMVMPKVLMRFLKSV